MATTKPEVQAPDESWALRVRGEIDRAMQRSIKGLEYLSAPPATVGSTPKEVLYSRGTLSLYHYLPMADEIYRDPAAAGDGHHQQGLHLRSGARPEPGRVPAEGRATTST